MQPESDAGRVAPFVKAHSRPEHESGQNPPARKPLMPPHLGD
jgi:hypothetical protein